MMNLHGGLTGCTHGQGRMSDEEFRAAWKRKARVDPGLLPWPVVIDPSTMKAREATVEEARRYADEPITRYSIRDGRLIAEPGKQVEL